MKPWQMELENRLTAPDAPSVLTRDLLARFAKSARRQPVPPSSLSYWLRDAVARQKLASVQQGLYLNRFRAAPGVIDDATPLLRTDAVVSLNRVLGAAGVLNNPSRVVTAVVPLDPGAPPPRLGRQSTRAGSFHFFGVPRRVLEAGKPGDRLEPPERFEHPRATPEKALIDWLYLAHSPRSRRTPPPKGDIDLALLNRTRLKALATAAGLRDHLDLWLQR